MNDDTLHPMTHPLLEDDLYWHGTPDPLFVRIGTPAPDPLPDGDYFCRVEVYHRHGGKLIDQDVVFGINALQAVENGFLWLRQNWPLVSGIDLN